METDKQDNTPAPGVKLDLAGLVKPLVWVDDGYGSLRSESIRGGEGIDRIYNADGSFSHWDAWGLKERFETPEAAIASVQADLAGDVAFALDLDAIAALVGAAREVKAIVEGIQGAMDHGTWRDDRGQRLKDTAQWVDFYTALARLGVTE